MKIFFFAALFILELVAAPLAYADAPATTANPALVHPFSPTLGGSRLSQLLQGIPVVDDLATMDKNGLLHAELPTPAWSDTYWPVMFGGAAWRYQDPNYPNSRDFKVNFEYFKTQISQHLPYVVWDTDVRSPAEKYDALVGDENLTLTKAAWQVGMKRYEQSGEVLDWEGSCHGWAPASYSEKEPQRSITVMSIKGEPITFKPSDIKALTTMSYATSSSPGPLVGEKCFDDLPDEDENGHAIKPECQDVNPGTWHLAAVNRLGVARTSFIMDVTAAGPIWNQPLVAYEYSYFNPQTMEESTALAPAVIAISRFEHDKFKAQRSTAAKYLVGINMVISYQRENQPSTDDVPAAEATMSVRYVYDLELDAAGKIIGGQWHSVDHPDFLWAPINGTHPRSYGESYYNVSALWNGKDTLPAPLLKAVPYSSRSGQPVYGIIKGLLTLSNSGSAAVNP